MKGGGNFVNSKSISLSPNKWRECNKTKWLLEVTLAQGGAPGNILGKLLVTKDEKEVQVHLDVARILDAFMFNKKYNNKQDQAKGWEWKGYEY